MEDHNHIAIQLARLEEKLDSFLFRTSATEARLTDHDARLRAVENSSAKIVGIGAGLAFIVSMVSQLMPIG